MTDEIRRALMQAQQGYQVSSKAFARMGHSNYGLQNMWNDREWICRNAMDVEDVLTHPEENVVAQLLTDEEIIESVIGINKDDIDEED
ncbi:hypothetical protein Tco_0235117 [Tanacetum coccineum]